ncbi:MAG: hypothetical protein K6T78_05735 [Alicyclobacillus sp.]|nr:hypothetical protein [Alicyclobacillus sp.]
MYGGVFGGYTRWAVVFLIIFVLFFLLVPYWGAGAVAAPGAGVAVTTYTHPHGGYNMMGGTYGYESASS